MIPASLPSRQPPPWQSALQEAITDPAELLALLGLGGEWLEPARTAARRFPLRVPRGFVGRMRRGDPWDPLLLQVLPLQAELEDVPGYRHDPVGDLIADSKQVAPDKPFFMYFCPGAAHAPHHVPKEWADKYKGQFDDGWDAYRDEVFKKQKELGIIPKDAELSRHDPDVQDWKSLSEGEMKLYARMMEVFAGFLTHTDYHYGRLFSFLKTLNEWDNTIIMFISDNGASSEGGPSGSVNENKFFNNVPDSLEQNLAMIDELGGPTTFNHYAWGWTDKGRARSLAQ